MKLRLPHEVESERHAAQERLDSLNDPIQRNKMGQYATPFPLARDIFEFVRDRYLTAIDGIRFLDPAVGAGAFFSALLHSVPKSRVEKAVGIEIDPQIAAIARDLWGVWGLDVIEADFTQLPFPDDPRYNLHLVNPPYVRHHHFDRTKKRYLQTRAKTAVGLNLSGLAGLYCYFLFLAHRWLVPNGFGVWLIPSEFMDVKYGDVVKRYLIEQVSLEHIHRFDAEDVQFGNALVSSTILIFQKREPEQEHEVTFSLGGTLGNPRTDKRILQRQLGDITKWTSIPSKSLSDVFRSVQRLNTTKTIGDLFEIRRGVATGANEFFILDREFAIHKAMPKQFLRPILPSPRYLDDEKILAANDGSLHVQPSLVLLDCNLEEADLVDYPILQAYLDWGKSQGFADRYITRHRQPWFKQENRLPAPILCSYMSRSKSGRSGLRFFRNYSEAIATNVYLMLYPTQVIQDACKHNENLLDELFDLLKQAKEEYLLYEGRTYGGGLHKIEPKELARVPLPDHPLLEQIGASPKQLVLFERNSS